MADLVTMVRLYARDAQELEVCGEVLHELRGEEEPLVTPIVLTGEEAEAACSGLKQRLIEGSYPARRVLRTLDYFYEEVA